MSASVIPGFGDIAGLLAYVVSDPRLFISSSTVMTTGFLCAAVALSLAAYRWSAAARVRAAIAPALALVLAYFALGSLTLSVVLFVRLHDALPLETEIQLVSGVAHLALGLIGIGLLAHALGRRRVPTWLRANLAAVAYWTLQLGLVRPPWFEFQEQGALTRGAAFAVLAASVLITAVLALMQSRGERRRLHPARSRLLGL